MMRAPPGAVVQAVRDELAVPGRYHLRGPAPQPSFFGELWDWISTHVSEFFQALLRHVHVGNGALNVVGFIVVALCVVGLLGVTVSLLLRVQLDATRRSAVAPIVAVRSADAYAQDAARAASRGDYARAVRALFIAAVIVLDVHGLVSVEQGATVNELRRALKTRDETLEPSFADIARAYTSAAYAEVPVDQQVYERASFAYGTLARGLST